ncbi:hypothetical protein EV421DRAFT_1913249 [Armillaria borealis]|uniref:Aminoglycoside phosphotransferase domain-containing protein n=1 Tax=Armillaria borealis TaxID=47425 RepID=A0AA39IWF8_9AGAR|nr:hypothetical protein EV421DRAFT_1913249 [Armillaria borealis]
MFPQPVLLLLYRTAIAVADTFAACFACLGPIPYPKDVDVDHHSDEELLKLSQSVPEKQWASSGAPLRLTSGVVAKLVPWPLTGWPSEALAQELVHNRTSIPVPAIRRVIHLDKDGSVIIMDHIPGITLAEAWPTMTLWQKIRTALTLRSYVHQLRSIQHPRSHIPGPPREGEEAGRCFALHIFSPMRPTQGPFPTADDLSQFFNHAMNEAALARLCSHKGPLPDDGTLVFSHVDLALRNLIMGKDGHLWLIDFATAGFYPQWFEYVNMRMDAEVEFGKEYDWVWNAILPFMCDPYFSIYDWITTVAPDYL